MSDSTAKIFILYRIFFREKNFLILLAITYVNFSKYHNYSFPRLSESKKLLFFKRTFHFAPGSPFTQEDVAWNCDSADEYTYAIYSFPQNYLKKDGRSNIRKYGNNFDATVALSLGAQVVNFTVDDPRITVNSADNMNFILTDIPNIEEVWFQFEYANSFFLSNAVGVAGSS